VQQGQIFQITRDHSMVQEMVEAKILTPDQAAVHPDANKITRALGIDDDVQVEVRQQPIAHVAGDAFILCSDGLSDLVEPHEILAIVSSDPAEQAAGKLVDLANARGGHDNITVVIVKPRVSAPAATGGGVGATVIDTTMTLRPPAAPPFAALAPLTPSILSGAPPAMPPPSVRPRTPPPSPPPSRMPLVAVAIGVLLAAALFWMRTVARREASAPTPTLALDAGLPAMDVPPTPTASVNLAPAALPAPSEIDASGVAPLEPVPSAPVRHSRKSAL
jgi:protein phosphatase